MQPKRVVVTGMGGITAIGSDWNTVEKNLRAGVTGIEYKTTEKKIFDVLARETISGMSASGLPIDKDKPLPQLLGELQAIRKCIVQAAEARKHGDTDVTAPLVAWLGGHGLKITDESIITSALQRNNQ